MECSFERGQTIPEAYRKQVSEESSVRARGVAEWHQDRKNPIKCREGIWATRIQRWRRRSSDDNSRRVRLNDA